MLLWLTKAPALLSSALEQRLLSRLLPGRRERVAAVRKPELRRARLAAYALEAFGVEAFTGHAPGGLSLAFSPEGKPFLPDCPGYRYNLSHSGDLVLLGADREEIGVDIERVRSLPPRVVRRCFTPEEAAWAGENAQRLTAVWTRKEAAAKWSGEGLSRILEGLDTLEGEAARRLSTFRIGDYVASVCGGHFEGHVDWLSLEDIVRGPISGEMTPSKKTVDCTILIG